MGNNMEVLSTVQVDKFLDIYKIVDSLNRTLKKENLMFGLALDKVNESKMVFTIYRT